MAVDDSTAPQRVRFTTRDQNEARAYLDDLYGIQLGVAASRETDWQLTVDMVDVGLFSSVDNVLPAHLRFSVDGQDEVVVSTVIDGAIEFERGQDRDQYSPGDVYIANHPHARDIANSYHSHAHTVTLPTSLLASTVLPSHQTPADPIRISSFEPVAGGAARWRQVTKFVNDLLADADEPPSPLVLGQAGRLLAATALTLFPNTLVAADEHEGRPDARPETVRRAVAYIESNPDEDIGVADIAAAAFVTPRSIQLAFRRYLATTPMAYLRRVRLDRAHADLLAADSDSTTVTAIAARWGFARSSRFSAAYRAAYGRSPSETLRS